MGKKSVINVDLADVWESRGRKKLLRTLAWGDEVNVLAEKSTHLEIELTLYEEQSDGSILPVSTTGYIEPAKSSGLKPADLTLPKKDNTVLKVNFVDVQQGGRRGHRIPGWEGHTRGRGR